MRSGQFLTSWMIQLLDEQKLYGIYCSLLSFLNSICPWDVTHVIVDSNVLAYQCNATLLKIR